MSHSKFIDKAKFLDMMAEDIAATNAEMARIPHQGEVYAALNALLDSMIELKGDIIAGKYDPT